MNETYGEFEHEFNEIERNLNELEDLYEKDLISLKSYFEVKNNILLKMIAISEEEKKRLLNYKF